MRHYSQLAKGNKFSFDSGNHNLSINVDPSRASKGLSNASFLALGGECKVSELGFRTKLEPPVPQLSIPGCHYRYGAESAIKTCLPSRHLQSRCSSKLVSSSRSNHQPWNKKCSYKVETFYFSS